jgi:2-polyprenyl-3-methyl-5-hydroxy-6-metoxy-1,4-benzoquinol methylase
MKLEDQIKEFYNINQFPGHYSISDFEQYSTPIENKYLNIIEHYLQDRKKILDIGCGTGLISNLFAYRNPTKQFSAIDFSNGIDYAIEFANQHKLKNVSFTKQDFTKWNTNEKFDCIICQGVLHHIPDYINAIASINSLLTDNGIIILGLYHPWGKLVKKFFSINYCSYTLYMDQEKNPYEETFTPAEVQKLFNNYKCIQRYPSLLNTVALNALFNYHNGGLITYVLAKN